MNIEWLVPECITLSHVPKWYSSVILSENKIKGDLSVILGDDKWLLSINQKFLSHDFYTDVITFDYCEGDIISGDIFISIERIIDNAEKFNVSRETELNRVLVHGLLHLLGYNDKSTDEIKIMREKEDFYLSML